MLQEEHTCRHCGHTGTNVTPYTIHTKNGWEVINNCADSIECLMATKKYESYCIKTRGKANLIWLWHRGEERL